jgi:tRNA-modifying protein YgfZ
MVRGDAYVAVMNALDVTVSLEAQVTALREGAGLRALDALGALGVRGRDRAKWLNGMITNDVRVLPPGRSVYAAVVGLKGKILTDLYVDAREDELLLVMPLDRLTEVSDHFDRYIVMEDVFVSPREVRVFSLQGPRAAEIAESLSHRFVADRLGRGGVDLVCPADDEAALASVSALVERGDVVVVSQEAWEVARVESGVGVFAVDFDTSHFVQEAGITARAVSFHKGCYLGQEVVCRLEMRGQVQRQLTGIVLDGAAPAVGDAVMLEGRDVGRVTSATRSATLPGRAVALAMVKHAAVEAGASVTVNGVAGVLTARPVP